MKILKDRNYNLAEQFISDIVGFFSANSWTHFKNLNNALKVYYELGYCLFNKIFIDGNEKCEFKVKPIFIPIIIKGNWFTVTCYRGSIRIIPYLYTIYVIYA